MVLHNVNRPFSESLLVDAASLRFDPRPTQGDVTDAIKQAEASGFIAGYSDELDGKIWQLTPKGILRARELA